MDLLKFYKRLEHLNQEIKELCEDVEASPYEIVYSYSDEVEDLHLDITCIIGALKSFHKLQLIKLGVDL
jgi:hypothetical protein